MKALVLIPLLLGPTSSTPLQDPAPLARKEPPTFHPAFMGLFHGDKLPGFDMLGRSPERASRKLYGVSGIPQMFVINKDGMVAASVTGYMKGEVLFDAALAKAGIRVDEATLKQAEEDLRKREQPR